MKLNLGQDFLDIKNSLTNDLKNFIADYQAKVGNFLVMKQTLIALKNRVTKLQAKGDSAVLAQLSGDIDAETSVQGTLEVAGFNILNTLNQLSVT